MTTYMHSRPVRTPDAHVVDPWCPGTRHGYYNAHRFHGCICPGASWDRYDRSVTAFREREKQRKAGQLAPTLTPARKTAARWPEVREAERLEKELWDRRDLACAHVGDPDVFTVIGTGPAARAQAREAAAICQTCPALALCRQVGLAVDRPDTFMGGLTYAERCDIRRGQQKEAA